MSWLQPMLDGVREEVHEASKGSYNEALNDVRELMHHVGLLQIKRSADWVPSDITREKVIELVKEMNDLWME